ncbi:uncharacterized protein SPPG_07470 [Spizellomyces punctatus DAOM BR117]|uniref:Mitochondrial glyco protein n=1 Tax=Spizellomyces punctatus (strain DAOM BR117) TaxID=645134 RepID=A0A0L0H816_SPIPD|nr:uncharacterized protein SPPG_07470 [Spizellomyces punctatus DAOM BR117]KNC97074.1 hypothetical protein SPPG_07470 [Spizellomyces punctatus DAOM BR117]|eukprot:XP_016605114.1 hypothetical protein SPPG_07470 [Spizellomyces punctatus DAOM BR117]
MFMRVSSSRLVVHTTRILQTRHISSQPRSHNIGPLLAQSLLKTAQEHTYYLPTEFKTSKGVLWKLNETLGDAEMVLSRTFGNEHISALFNVDAMSEFQDFADMEHEPAFGERPPVGLSIVIQKKTDSIESGALEIEASAKYPNIFINHITVFPSVDLCMDSSAQGDWQRRGLYSGPSFQQLPETLQDLFQEYITERGFDEELALRIHDIVEAKDQKEWDVWVKNVGNFIDI